jgi:hypothetical protein
MRRAQASVVAALALAGVAFVSTGLTTRAVRAQLAPAIIVAPAPAPAVASPFVPATPIGAVGAAALAGPNVLAGPVLVPNAATGMTQPGQPAFATGLGNTSVGQLMSQPGQPGFFEGVGFNAGVVPPPNTTVVALASGATAVAPGGSLSTGSANVTGIGGTPQNVTSAAAASAGFGGTSPPQPVQTPNFGFFAGYGHPLVASFGFYNGFTHR